MAHDPGLGASEDAALIRNVDHSASGIAPLTVQDKTAGVLAIQELCSALSPDG